MIKKNLQSLSRKRSRGIFVSFEGIDGCGKSTQIELLRQTLSSAGLSVVCTREPGGTCVSEGVRSILLSKKKIRMDSKTELLLYLAARAQHVEEIIRPALDDGAIVLCDRFHDSTLAYQGRGRGLSDSKIRMLLDFASQGLWPTLTLYFDVPVSVSLARMQKGRRVKDRMEQEGARFLEMVRKGYLSLLKKEPKRMALIPAHESIEKVQALVLEQWNRSFPKPGLPASPTE